MSATGKTAEGVTTYQLPPNITYHQHRDYRIENWLIVGTGPTVEEDWAQVRRFPPAFLARSEVVLLNRAEVPDSGAGPSRLAAHHVTFHPEYFHITPQYVSGCARRHSNVAMPYTTDCWHIPDQYHVGGSAFFAAYIAKQLGVQRAILIGCPLSGGSAHTELLNQFARAPRVVRQYYFSVMSSLSGHTRELFGPPTTLPLHTHTSNSKEDY